MAETDNRTIQELEAPIDELEKRLNEILEFSRKTGVNLDERIKQLETEIKGVVRAVYTKLNPWQRIQIARHPGRPDTDDYVRLMVDDFVELRGDRNFADDPTCLCGLGKIGGVKLFFIGQRKGSDTESRIKYNFGSMHPEGYRKALRKMKLAEKFGIPIVTFVNTPGAYPGIGAEERGQAWAIAENIYEMSGIKTPILSIIIGEGGSGGALGICVADKLSILENAYLSVITPEGCAAILWKDSSKANLAANVLKIVPDELKKLGIIDDIIQEPIGGAHRNHSKMAETLKSYISKTISELELLSIDKLLENRWNKYRNMGKFVEGEVARWTNV